MPTLYHAMVSQWIPFKDFFLRFGVQFPFVGLLRHAGCRYWHSSTSAQYGGYFKAIPPTLIHVCTSIYWELFVNRQQLRFLLLAMGSCHNWQLRLRQVMSGIHSADKSIWVGTCPNCPLVILLAREVRSASEHCHSNCQPPGFIQASCT